MKEGQLFESKQFYSTSATEDIAKRFLETDESNSEDGLAASYILEIRGKSGVSIRGISTFPEEEEILFTPGTLFKVVKVDETHPGRFHVVLKEI